MVVTFNSDLGIFISVMHKLISDQCVFGCQANEINFDLGVFVTEMKKFTSQLRLFLSEIDTLTSDLLVFIYPSLNPFLFYFSYIFHSRLGSILCS